MKVLVFSDIHGNYIAFKALLNLLPTLSYDRIFFLGDIFGYYYDQENCLKLLREMQNMIWLKGNHDAYAVNAFYDRGKENELIEKYGHSYSRLTLRFASDEMDKIEALPSFYECVVDDRKVAFFHGRPSDPLEGRIYENTLIQEDEVAAYDVVFFGHTHCKIDRMVGNTRLLSPGSLGQPRDGKGYGFLTFDFENNRSEFINVDVDNRALRNSIDSHDHDFKKLYDVLVREDQHPD